ncbi:MAG TPA: 4-(cytidine 5'-diphospho)-2-C-methyl-D-erythritol kinase [Longimicrobiales bacterium]|nr:4-(cytidine 5'-diphospho)-2-C-methyl-D-erythritol kinase [Longimicrobiales bacterium]
MNDSLRVLAHAKLNLSLRVLAREESGFHQIETLFCLLELADEIEVDRAGGDISLTVLPPPEDAGRVPDLGPVADNLARRAADAFFREAALPRQAAIRLTKRIPAGAGLGGGSSDAAAVLTALNQLHDEPLSMERLMELAGTLGSDVPFFVAGARLALAWGRGTRVAPLPPLPSRAVLLAVPGTAVNTAAAYARLADARGAGQVAPPALVRAAGDWDVVTAGAVNDFEDVVFRIHPELQQLRDAMAGAGAFLARMTGSGSVIFGVFEDVRTAEAAQETLAAAFSDCRWVLSRTLE